MVPSSRRASFQETCCISPVQSSLCSPCWKCHSSWQVAVSYWTLKSSSCLLLRLCYLREQKALTDCAIVRLFDPALSPRAYALQASRISHPCAPVLWCQIICCVGVIFFCSRLMLWHCWTLSLWIEDVGSREASPVLLASQTSCSNHVYIWINCDEGGLKFRWKSFLIGSLRSKVASSPAVHFMEDSLAGIHVSMHNLSLSRHLISLCV